MARHHLLEAVCAAGVEVLVFGACGSDPSTQASSESTGTTTVSTLGTFDTSATTAEPTTGAPGTDTSSESSTNVDTTLDPATDSSDAATSESSTGDSSVCGDGILHADEGCDDANLIDFDGCSAECRVELAATQLWVGGGTACAAFEDASLRCWGGGISGTNGSESMNSIGDEPGEMGGALEPVDLGANFLVDQLGGHPCARSGPSVKCWGLAWFLGLGILTGSLGDEPGEMDDALPPIDAGDDVIWLGEYCVYLDAGLKCWGPNNWGGLGLGDTEDRGDEPGEMGDSLPYVDLGSMGTLVDQCTSSTYRCAVDDLGQLKCWGLNSRGMLGTEDYEDRGDEPGEMGDALVPIDVGSDAAVAQVACGRETVCVVREDGALK